jgi:bifunctional DNA-binding transcriptional regulator/antitoxin component of YhaV-PrlF toxin-antitoxin module
MDRAGRVVIPAALRAQLGIVPGPIDLQVDGSGLRMEIPAEDNVAEHDGFLMIEGEGPEMTADDIRELRLADQR